MRTGRQCTAGAPPPARGRLPEQAHALDPTASPAARWFYWALPSSLSSRTLTPPTVAPQRWFPFARPQRWAHSCGEPHGPVGMMIAFRASIHISLQPWRCFDVDVDDGPNKATFQGQQAIIGLRDTRRWAPSDCFAWRQLKEIQYQTVS